MMRIRDENLVDLALALQILKLKYFYFYNLYSEKAACQT